MGHCEGTNLLIHMSRRDMWLPWKEGHIVNARSRHIVHSYLRKHRKFYILTTVFKRPLSYCWTILCWFFCWWQRETFAKRSCIRFQHTCIYKFVKWLKLRILWAAAGAEKNKSTESSENVRGYEYWNKRILSFRWKINAVFHSEL